MDWDSRQVGIKNYSCDGRYFNEQFYGLPYLIMTKSLKLFRSMIPVFALYLFILIIEKTRGSDSGAP